MLGHRLPHRTPFLSPRLGCPSLQGCLGALSGPEPRAGTELSKEHTAHSPLNRTLCQALGCWRRQLLSWGRREKQGSRPVQGIRCKESNNQDCGERVTREGLTFMLRSKDEKSQAK